MSIFSGFRDVLADALGGKHPQTVLDGKRLDYLLIDLRAWSTRVECVRVRLEPFLVDDQPFWLLSDHYAVLCDLVLSSPQIASPETSTIATE